MRIINWLKKSDDELPINNNEMIRKINNHLTETEKEINYGRQLLNEQDITVAFPKSVNRKTCKYEDESALFNRPLNIYNYKKIEFPIVVYNPRKKNENNYITDNIIVKALLTKVEKYNTKSKKNSVSCIINKNNKSNNNKILPPIVNHYIKISPIKIKKDNEQNNTYISTIFKNTSCEDFNIKKSRNDNTNSYYSPILHKNLDDVFQSLDDKTSRTNEVSEKIREGIKEINDYKLKIRNKKSFTAKKCNFDRILINKEPFDKKDIKKFPIISRFDNLGKIRKVEEIQEVIYKDDKNDKKNSNKLSNKKRKSSSKKNND